ncbi:Fc.00g068670.m01.CDS01 [Cosmosporella sp. VM-42]
MARHLPKRSEGSNSLPNLHQEFKQDIHKTLPIEKAGEPTSTYKRKSKTAKGPPIVPQRHPLHQGSRPTRPKVTLCSHVFSDRSQVRPNIPRRTSSIRGSLRSTALDGPGSDIIDRDVLRGLHIAASAACDEEIDAFICNKTGLQIRRFLADLMALENLSDERPGQDSEQRDNRRKSELRRLKQHVRRSREIRKFSTMTK